MNNLKEKSKDLFGDKFDFTNTIYVNTKTRLNIKCIKHNEEFSVTPENHIKSKYGGCIKCKNNNNFKDNYTLDKLVNESNSKFNNRFNFSKVNLINYTTPVIIICKKHNKDITITPFNHLSQVNGGCVSCKEDNKKNNKVNIELKEGEEIKEIKIKDNMNYDGLYQISNLGRCFSMRTNQEVKGKLDGGYIRVNLYDKDMKNNKFLVHKLVCIAFNNDYTNDKVIDHIDNDRTNNKLSNLQIITQSENIKKSHKTTPRTNHIYEIQIYDKDNKLIQEFDSVNEAVNHFKYASNSTILKCLKNGKMSKGFYWKYKDENLAKEKTLRIEDINGFKCIGNLDDYNFSNYFINQEGTIINKDKKNKPIKQKQSPDGYIIVYLSIDNTPKTYRLHRLIAKYFLENGETYYYNPKYVVNHKNSKRDDNNINNLEWVTQKENAIHGNGKKVIQMNKDTNEVIAIFNTLTEACKQFNSIDTYNITKSCKDLEGKRLAFGFKWKFSE